MDEQIKALRSQIALLDEDIAFHREMLRDLIAQRAATEAAESSKIDKISTLVATKLAGLSDDDPKRAQIETKVAALKKISAEKLSELEKDAAVLLEKINEFINQSAVLTKEMLALIP